MEVFGVLVAVVLSIAFAFVIGHYSYEHTAGNLRAFADMLEDGYLVLDTGMFRSMTNTTARGRLKGRRVRLSFRVVSTGKTTITYTQFEVDAPHAAAGFEVTKAGMFQRFGRWLGLVDDVETGDASFDDRFIVAGGRRSVKKLLQSQELKDSIEHTLEHGFPSLELSGDTLHAERVGSLEPASLYEAFRDLCQVAALCERRRVKVKVLGERRRFGWTAGGEQVRCPYCRDEVDLEGEQVAACPDCDTVHHRECLEEAGRCTIFGCEGRLSA